MRAMQMATDLRPEHQIMVDYVSPEGATVTHVRANVVVASIQLLKQGGLYDRYLAQLAPNHQDQLIYAIASSWMPVEVIMAHCAACDDMKLSERELAEHGEMIAKFVGDSIFGNLTRGAKAMGMVDGWFFSRQTGRLWPRTYRGGGCTLLQTGPKDMVFEVHGLPMMMSRFYRASHHGYMKGFARMFSTAHFVKAVRPREPHPHRAATAISWV